LIHLLHWFDLTPERLKWPERFFILHGAKTVFAACFIFLFPLVVVNLVVGMSKMSWHTFLLAISLLHHHAIVTLNRKLIRKTRPKGCTF